MNLVKKILSAASMLAVFGQSQAMRPAFRILGRAVPAARAAAVRPATAAKAVQRGYATARSAVRSFGYKPAALVGLGSIAAFAGFKSAHAQAEAPQTAMTKSDTVKPTTTLDKLNSRNVFLKIIDGKAVIDFSRLKLKELTITDEEHAQAKKAALTGNILGLAGGVAGAFLGAAATTDTVEVRDQYGNLRGYAQVGGEGAIPGAAIGASLGYDIGTSGKDLSGYNQKITYNNALRASSGLSILGAAARNNATGLEKWALISKFQETDPHGVTALMYAAATDSRDAAKLIIRHAPQLVSVKDNDGKRASDYAKECGNAKMVRLLEWHEIDGIASWWRYVFKKNKK